jgi:hypothetical protein
VSGVRLNNLGIANLGIGGIEIQEFESDLMLSVNS